MAIQRTQTGLKQRLTHDIKLGAIWRMNDGTNNIESHEQVALGNAASSVEGKTTDALDNSKARLLVVSTNARANVATV